MNNLILQNLWPKTFEKEMEYSKEELKYDLQRKY
jgi:hypothetical protein